MIFDQQPFEKKKGGRPQAVLPSFFHQDH